MVRAVALCFEFRFSLAYRPLLYSVTILSATSAFTSHGFAESVTETFNKGRKLFEQGKLRASYKILKALAKKYPDHQPSQIILGRILFKIGKTSAAARRFKRVSPDMIAPDFAYEYGIVMFTVKQCQKAQLGFARVPSNSKLAPLASFYRGICYARTQDWQRAYRFLTKAKGIPGNLETTRRQALTQVKRSLRAEQVGSVSSGPIIFTPTPAPPIYQDPSGSIPQAPVPPDVSKPATPPPPPATGWSTAITPGVTYTQISTTQEFGGTGTKNSQDLKSEAKLGIKPKYLASARSFGAQPYFSLGIDFNQVNRSVKGNKVTFIAYENDPGTIVEQQTGVDDKNENYLEIKGTPEASYPVTKTIDITGGYSLKEKLPNMNTDKMSSASGPYGNIAYSGDSFGVKGSGAVTDYTSDAEKPIKTDTMLSAELTKDFETVSLLASYKQTETVAKQPVPPGKLADFNGTATVIAANGTKRWETFSVTLGGTDTTYDTGNPLLIKVGETQKTVLELSANKSFDFGGSLTFTAQQATLSGFHQFFADKNAAADADPKPQVLITATGTEQTFITVFKLTPLDWLSGSISYKYSTATYSQGNADYQKDFIQAVPDLTSEFTMLVSVSKTF